MSSKRILGIAGAAMMGTLAGTSQVHAYLGSTTDAAAGATLESSITFARETFHSGRKITPTTGSGNYYEAAAAQTASGELEIRIPLGITVSANQEVTIEVELTNLVIDAFTVTGGTRPHAEIATAAAPTTALTTAQPTVRAGGADGDRMVLFGVTPTIALTPTHRLIVKLDRIGVDPMANGTITITRGFVFAGRSIEAVTTLTDVIKTAPGLKVTATPQNQTAAVDDMFTKFKSGTGVADTRLTAHVGHLQIAHATPTPPLYSANRGAGQITGATDLVAATSPITIEGVTSFIGEDGKVFVGTSAACSDADSIVQDDGSLEATVGDFDVGGGYLCITVDGETAITPTTTPYIANVDYTGVDGAVADLVPADASFTLGRIGRDGSSVRIAQLTTNQKYNQRIIVMNRNSSPVDYSMSFTTSDGITARPGDAATGQLPVGRTVLNVSDVVTFDHPDHDNGANGSAEMMMVTTQGTVDVATVTTTRSDGSTDTVVWESVAQ